MITLEMNESQAAKLNLPKRSVVVKQSYCIIPISVGALLNENDEDFHAFNDDRHLINLKSSRCFSQYPVMFFFFNLANTPVTICQGRPFVL